MAIIIQEEAKKSNLTTLIVAGLILLTAGAIVYYFFFSPVPLAENIEGGDKYQAISKLANAKIDVEKVTGSSVWKALVRPNPTPALDTKLPSRRSNPFEAF